MTELYVCYFRVSTTRQGAVGLGMDAQKRAASDFLRGGDRTVVAEFQEVESGKRTDRPALDKAIDRCRMTGARLLIAKLDRLSRDAHFLLGLEKRGVDFVACDMPHANRLTVGIMALVAQEERLAISHRTKSALASINKRIEADGMYIAKSGRSISRLGNPNPAKIMVGSAAGVAAFQANADAFAARIAPTARALLASEGSLNRAAARLNQMHVTTARGGVWTAKAVQRVLERDAS